MLSGHADEVVEGDVTESGPDRPSTPSADEFYSARYQFSTLFLFAESSFANSCPYIQLMYLHIRDSKTNLTVHSRNISHTWKSGHVSS